MVPAGLWPRSEVTPTPLPFGAPFAARGGSVVALRTVELSWLGEVGGASEIADAPAGRGRPREGPQQSVSISSCLLLPASALPGPASLLLGLNRKPDTSEKPSPK
jgi:hypothetical protein